MDQDNQLSREKAEALERLTAALRLSQNAHDIMDDAFTQLLGVNRTDGRCIDIVHRLGRITAGELARESGLTTGAVTAAIDRLETAGYLKRTRDTEDRRKVFVEVTDLANKLGQIVYAEVAAIGANGMTQMPLEDMDLVTRFLNTSAALNRKMAETLQDYVGAQAQSPAERLLAAKNYAARVRREADDYRAEMSRAWREVGTSSPVD